MRQAFNNVAVLNSVSEQGSSVKGISLGYDHCAEHEWGTSGIRSALGVSPNYSLSDFIQDYDSVDKSAPRSIEDFKVSPKAKVLLLTTEINAVHLKSGYSSEKKIEEEYKQKYKVKFNKKRVPATKARIAILMTVSWSVHYLAERLQEKHPDLAKKLTQPAPQHIELNKEEFNTINEYFLKCNTGVIRTQSFVNDAKENAIEITLPSYWSERPESHWGSDEFMFITTGRENCAVMQEVYNQIIAGNAYYGVKTESNPFSRSSPCLIASEISEIEKETISKEWQDIRVFAKELLALGIYDKLKQSGKRYYALSPKKKEDGSLIFWLNPQEQNRYNSGWFTLEQLNQWAENSGPVLKE